MEVTDADVQRFIVEGFAVQEIPSRTDLHKRIHTLAEDMEPTYVSSRDEAPATVDWETKGGFGSDRQYGQDTDGTYYAVQKSKLQPIHTMMDYTAEGTPQHELQAAVDQVFDSPEARSYLTAILGNNYVMDASPHTLQNSKPGREGQQWHKGQVGKRQFHQPRFVFGFYFPQEVTITMGPTHVCARSQYLVANYPADFSQADAGVNYLGHAGAGGVYYDLQDGVHEIPAAYGHQKFVTCPAGSILIVHYDIWHRGSGNTSDLNRHMFKKYFFRTEEPAVAGPSWVHRSPKWSPSLDGPVLPEHSLLPVWLSIWQWMCGATDDENFCIEDWEKCPDLHLALTKPNDFAEDRLHRHGGPWCVVAPPEAYGSRWSARPGDVVTQEGIFSEIAALRAAYILAHTVTPHNAVQLVDILVQGSKDTFIAGHTGAIAAFNASHALQMLCLRPSLVVEARIIPALLDVLNDKSAPSVARVVMCNHAAYALGDICAAVVAAATLPSDATNEITAVVDTFAQMLPPVADNSVLAVSIQPAVVEAMGNIGAAIAAKLLFLYDGNSAQLASDKHPSGGAQPVAAAASAAEPSDGRKALQKLYDTLRSTMVSAIDFEENNTSRPRSAAMNRLENINQHLQDSEKEEIMLIKKLKALPRGDSIVSYCNLSLRKMGVKPDTSSSPRLDRGLSTDVAFVTSSAANMTGKFLYWTN